MKKLIALLLALALVGGMVACSSNAEVSKPADETTQNDPASQTGNVQNNDLEPIVLDYWYMNGVGEQEYTKQVEEKLNEWLSTHEGYENISIRLHPCNDYATDLKLAFASGQQVDIISTYGSGGFVSHAQNEEIIPIDDLLAEYPEATAELPTWLLDLGKMDGKTYVIPNYQQAASQNVFIFPKDYLDMTDYSVEDIHNLMVNKTPESIKDFLTTFVDQVRAGTGLDTKYAPYNPFETYFWMGPSNVELSISGRGYLYWNTDTQALEFSMTNETMEQVYKMAAELREEGYLLPDSSADISNFAGPNMKNTESLAFCNNWDVAAPDEYNDRYSKMYGFETEVLVTDAVTYIPSSWAAEGLGISATCENPEAAMAVITLLENSKYADFYNTLMYGLEGVHYTDNGDGTVTTLEFDAASGGGDCSYSYWRWVGGNSFNLKCNQAMSQKTLDFIENDLHNGENTVYSPLMGFQFDRTSFETELSQVASVISEYDMGFYYGDYLENTEAKFAEFKEKLETAGLSKILEEANRQAAEYISSK